MDSGKLFEKQFKQSCKCAGFWTQRITDNTYRTKYGVRSKSTPADFIIATNEQVWLVECKAVKGKSLPFNRLEEHQIKSLTEFDKGFRRGVIAINMYGDRRKFNKLFLLDIVSYTNYIETCDRKSLPLAWLEENAVVAEREAQIWKIPIQKI